MGLFYRYLPLCEVPEYIILEFVTLCWNLPTSFEVYVSAWILAIMTFWVH